MATTNCAGLICIERIPRLFFSFSSFPLIMFHYFKVKYLLSRALSASRSAIRIAEGLRRTDENKQLDTINCLSPGGCFFDGLKVRRGALYFIIKETARGIPIKKTESLINANNSEIRAFHPQAGVASDEFIWPKGTRQAARMSASWGNNVRSILCSRSHVSIHLLIYIEKLICLR